MPSNNTRRTSFGERNNNARPSSNSENETNKTNELNNGKENTAKDNDSQLNNGQNNTEPHSDKDTSSANDGGTTNNSSSSNQNESSEQANSTDTTNGVDAENTNSNKDEPNDGSSDSGTSTSSASGSSDKIDAENDKKSMGDKAKDFIGNENNQQSAVNILSADDKTEAMKEEAKKLAKAELKKQAIAGAKPAAIAGTKVGGVTGAGGFALIKGIGMVSNGIKALASTAPAVFIQQLANLGGKAVGTITGFVNGTINGFLSAIKVSATATGIAPTIIASTVLVSSVGGGVIVATSGAAGGKLEDAAACVQPQDETSSTSNEDDGIIAVGDYTVVGSEKYKIAETLFKNFTETNGWSGAGSAGGIGNAIRESGLDPKADNPSGGVHGLFQWSGWSNQKNDDRWVKAPGGKIDTLENQIALLNLEINEPYYVNLGLKTKVGKAIDYKVAAWHFAVIFEGIGRDQYNEPVTHAGAKWAYETFGGANIEADESILNAPGEANDEIQIIEKAKEDGCEDETGLGNGAEDGTGEYTASAVKPYIPSKLPNDLKKFAYDPKDVGLAYGNAEGWGKPGGQCVHLASSYFKAIWGIDETPFGNGHELALNWSKLIKGELSNTPTKGAITGITGTVPGISTAPYGHTNVVQHVFANGDILVVEQNYPNVSGDDGPIESGGTGPYTWHYSVIPKEIYIKYNFDFFVPDTKKYKLNMGKNTIS